MAQPISKDQFEREHRKYQETQIEGVAILRQSVLTPDTQQFYLNSNELSFVFEKKLVLELLNQPGAEYLRVYYGAIPAGYNPLGKPVGSPTMILSAAKHHSPYSDVGTLYIEWPTGLDAGGNEIP